MSGGPMATVRENVNLDDPEDVERAMTEAETEEAKSAILAAASSLPIGRATLRVGLEPVKVEKGMVNPQTGEEMEEDGVALRQSVMFSWVTEEYDWCPKESDARTTNVSTHDQGSHPPEMVRAAVARAAAQHPSRLRDGPPHRRERPAQ